DQVTKWAGQRSCNGRSAASPKPERQQASASRGGLWISGELAEAMSRLRWIAGTRGSSLLQFSEDGRVSFNVDRTERAAAVWALESGRVSWSASEFLHSDDGLLLLFRVINGPERFLIRVGRLAPTLGGDVSVRSTVNLDNKYDSRINPRRAL